jgi:hypothetical protein
MGEQPPVTVLAAWEQAKANTASERASERARRGRAISVAEREAAKRALPQARIRSLQEIGFYAEQSGRTIGPITVLAGSGAPTVTGGWPKIASVQRFQRESFTVPEGYEPRTLSVPIQFEAVAVTRSRPDVEAQVARSRPRTFRTTMATDTIKRVAIALAARFRNKHLAKNWQPILEANPSIGSAEKKLRVGTVVKIPASYWAKVPR